MRALRLGPSVRIDDVELIPIDTLVMRADLAGGLVVATAAKEPFALVVRAHGGTRALDLDGREMRLEDLARQVEGLTEALQGRPAGPVAER